MGHWYTKDGSPCHFQTKKDGGQRDTTLRDARKLNLYPSVTEIINVAAKPGLEKWKINQTLLAALTLPRVEGETVDSLAKRIDEDAKAQMIKARDLGTEIHAALEASAIGEPNGQHEIICEAVDAAIKNETGHHIYEFDAERSFSHKAGYGGMIDLSGHGFVIDYKSKEFGIESTKKQMAWDEQGMQLSAYAHGIDAPNAIKMNVYISTSEVGLVHIHKWDNDLYDRFECLLKYWQLSKGYCPE